jgi:nickel superoxide dismutase
VASSAQYSYVAICFVNVIISFTILNQTTEKPMIKALRKIILSIALTAVGYGLILPQLVYAHCQIPCGIYDDHARVVSMLEDAATVEKSAKLIAELAGKSDAESQNQLVRWVMNKENHAQKIISTISDYFLTQRVKPSQKDYAESLKKHHAVIIAAMKAKQNADVKYAKTLKESIEALSSYYPEHKH